MASPVALTLASGSGATASSALAVHGTPTTLALSTSTASLEQSVWAAVGEALLAIGSATAATAAVATLEALFDYRVYVQPSSQSQASWRISDSLASLFSSFWEGYVLANYAETVQWLPAITENTPGATPTKTFDDIRRYPTTFSDGSFGVGWQAPSPVSGKIYIGYFPAQTVNVAINDRATTQRIQESGKVTYTSPRIYYMPPANLQKGDIIVRTDGTRCVVGDNITPAQVMGITIVSAAELETRTKIDPVYQVPLV